MIPLTHSPFATLTRDQQARAEQLWHDGLPPTDFLYKLQGGHVVGRVDAVTFLNGKHCETDYGLPPALPQPVSSSRREAPKLTLQQIRRELAFPGTYGRRRYGLAEIFINGLSLWLYQMQERRTQ
jgi:hypothetical protein